MQDFSNIIDCMIQIKSIDAEVTYTSNYAIINNTSGSVVLETANGVEGTATVQHGQQPATQHAGDLVELADVHLDILK